MQYLAHSTLVDVRDDDDDGDNHGNIKIYDLSDCEPRDPASGSLWEGGSFVGRSLGGYISYQWVYNKLPLNLSA